MSLACGISAHWYPGSDEAMLNARLRSDDSVVAVHYDRADPSRPVLDRGTIRNGSAGGVVLTLSVALNVFPASALALTYVSWKKHKQVSQQLTERGEPLQRHLIHSGLFITESLQRPG